MKKYLVFGLFLVLSFNVNAITRLQSLLCNYCYEVASAYHSGDNKQLEKCIDGYIQKKYNGEDGPYIMYNDTTVHILPWKGLAYEGSARQSVGKYYSFIPPMIDLYLAHKQYVEKNSTPPLRSSYDYKYAEVMVKANSSVKLKAVDSGIWRVVAACAYKAHVSISLKDSNGEDVNMSLDYDNPASAIEWRPSSEDVEITLSNHSNINVSVFIAKN
jgi:hypothetical protein